MDAYIYTFTYNEPRVEIPPKTYAIAAIRCDVQAVNMGSGIKHILTSISLHNPTRCKISQPLHES